MKISNSKVEFANALRGWAAMFVIVAHILGVFWLNPAAIEAITKYPALDLAVPDYITALHFSPLFNYGAFGVAIFFLISGFVIPFSMSKLSSLGFLLARIIRIFPVYILALSIGLLTLFFLGNILFDDYQFPYNLKDIIIQASLMRGWYWVPSLDGISWTLEIELVFYVLGAIYLPFVMKKGSKALMPIVAILFLCNFLFYFLINNVTGIYQTGLLFLTYCMPFVIYMNIGVFFHLFYINKISLSQLVQGVCLCLMLFMISMNLHVALKSAPTSNYLIALLVFIIFYFCNDSFKTNTFIRWLADISYPLYAIHPILGYGTMYYLASQNISPLTNILITLTLLIFVSYILHILIEKPSIKLGKKIPLHFKLTRKGS